MILNKEQIRELILHHDLITDYVDLETQLQPNGFDLTVEEMFAFHPKPFNKIKFDTKEIERKETIFFGGLYNRWGFEKGVYKFKINETIKLPNNICAVTTQRSSVMRMGNSCNVGYWDAGYHGSGYSTIQVNNFVEIWKDARLIQMYFYELEETSEPYNGNYQKENVKVE